MVPVASLLELLNILLLPMRFFPTYDSKKGSATDATKPFRRSTTDTNSVLSAPASSHNASGSTYNNGFFRRVSMDGETLFQGFSLLLTSRPCATTIKAGRRRQLKLPSWEGGFSG